MNLAHKYKWSKNFVQIPLEVRFLHNPEKAHAFVGTALGSAIYHFYRGKVTFVIIFQQYTILFSYNLKDENEQSATMSHRVAAQIPPKSVEGWILPEIPALSVYLQ